MGFETNLYLSTHPDLSPNDRAWHFKKLENKQLVIEQFLHQTSTFNPIVPKNPKDQKEFKDGYFYSIEDNCNCYLTWAMNKLIKTFSFLNTDHTGTWVFDFETGKWSMADATTLQFLWIPTDLTKNTKDKFVFEQDLLTKSEAYSLKYIEVLKAAEKAILQAKIDAIVQKKINELIKIYDEHKLKIGTLTNKFLLESSLKDAKSDLEWFPTKHDVGQSLLADLKSIGLVSDPLYDQSTKAIETLKTKATELVKEIEAISADAIKKRNEAEEALKKFTKEVTEKAEQKFRNRQSELKKWIEENPASSNANSLVASKELNSLKDALVTEIDTALGQKFSTAGHEFFQNCPKLITELNNFSDEVNKKYKEKLKKEEAAAKQAEAKKNQEQTITPPNPPEPIKKKEETKPPVIVAPTKSPTADAKKAQQTTTPPNPPVPIKKKEEAKPPVIAAPTKSVTIEEQEKQEFIALVTKAKDYYAEWYNVLQGNKKGVKLSELTAPVYRGLAGSFFGIFSMLRHTVNGQKRAMDLIDDIFLLSKSSKLENMFKRVNKFLSESKTNYNRHSFACFLLDQLKNSKFDYLNLKIAANLYTEDNIYSKDTITELISKNTSPSLKN